MDLERALAQPPHESVQKTELNRPSRIETIPLEILTRIFSICRDDVWLRDPRDPEEDDGDENKIDPKSVFDPRVAPMLLGRVCPSFRQAALQTPLLWDNVTFTTYDLVSTGRLPGIQTILARSGNLPLTIHFSTLSTGSEQAVLKNGTAQFLQRVWEFHPRFEHLTFFIPCTDVQLDSLPAPTTLPLLRSLDIEINEISETSPSLPALLRVFEDAPLLRSLTLYDGSSLDATSHIFHPDFFPWHQLTKLTSHISLTTTTARDILRHCHGLETCELGNLEPVHILHQPPLCILNQMRSLKLSATNDLPFIGFFDSLAFPRLESLTLDNFTVPGHSLLELHGRSQSQIERLALDSLRLTADEIIQLLRLTPSLQMFSFDRCITRSSQSQRVGSCRECRFPIVVRSPRGRRWGGWYRRRRNGRVPPTVSWPSKWMFALSTFRPASPRRSEIRSRSGSQAGGSMCHRMYGRSLCE
ncbi:hypothetical protein DFH07DRAFT_293405 [Mycena maculata]|uniref:F-box domain-containing protein n=1 Tax=Mycena maculata TaxID=230809 RepID=A0AAD7HL10_9AGAR|nr:hypothetical protein DFH07DRAFT_293405 [Mycena maculata]